MLYKENMWFASKFDSSIVIHTDLSFQILLLFFKQKVEHLRLKFAEIATIFLAKQTEHQKSKKLLLLMTKGIATSCFYMICLFLPGSLP